MTASKLLMVALLSFICAFTVAVSPVSGATTIEDQSQFDKEEMRKFRRGQLDELEVGSTVWFKPSDDKQYVDELFPDQSFDTEEADVSASSSSASEEEQPSYEGSSEIRLENGVWVN